jgi:ferredoxin
MAKITFLKSEKTFEIPIGTDLVKIYEINPDLPLKFGCKQGECGVCEIKISTGHENLTKHTPQEKRTLNTRIKEGSRLACQCALKGDIIIN